MAASCARSRRTTPRLNPSNPGETYINPYSDGTPASVHTYDAVEYLPTVDRIWSVRRDLLVAGRGVVTVEDLVVESDVDRVGAKVTRPGGYGTSSRWLEVHGAAAGADERGTLHVRPRGRLVQGALPARATGRLLDTGGGREGTRRSIGSSTASCPSSICAASARSAWRAVTGDTPFVKQGGIAILFDRGKLIVFGAGPGHGSGNRVRDRSGDAGGRAPRAKGRHPASASHAARACGSASSSTAATTGPSRSGKRTCGCSIRGRRA